MVGHHLAMFCHILQRWIIDTNFVSHFYLLF
jgi:hypothetical protein